LCLAECERDYHANVLKNYVHNPGVVQHFTFLQRFWRKAQVMQNKMQVGDLSFECALCGIAINEIEGFIIENATTTEIVNYITNNVCTFLSGPLQIACNQLALKIPYIVETYENRWTVSKICVDLGFCTAPFDPHTDPVSLPTYVVNLDAAPADRWKSICSIQKFKTNAQYLYNIVQQILPYGGKNLEFIGESLNFFFPKDYGLEIQGCADALGIPFGWLTLFNLGYEVSDACTSIVAQTVDGKILHARNLDFWEGMGFTATLKELAFVADMQKGGKTLFKATTFAGYVGVLSAMKPNAFSLTIDTRFYPDGIEELFYEIIAALTEKNASLVSFLSRNVMTYENDFKAALQNLANGTLIADVYYILAGTKRGEGVVISRNRQNAADIWMIDTSVGRWFEVETNYDHWVQAPWFDNRVDPANAAMNAIGQKNVTLDNMMKVLSTKPVFNIQTTYSILSCPADSIYISYARYCPYPCVE